jgi:hypothetical protein
MGESMESPPRGEDHRTRPPRYSSQFLLPSSVPHNMLHASNLKHERRGHATHHSQWSMPGKDGKEDSG